LESALAVGNVVIATGGGVACIDPAMHVLQAARVGQRGLTVWLRCSPSILRARLAADPGDRPSLTGQDPVDEAIEVAASRAERYAEAADFEVDADGAPAAVAALIAGQLKA
jgi:shikimate kinase